MCPSPAAGAQLSEEAGIRVGRKDHGAGTVGDVIIWVGGNIVQELDDGRAGGLGGGSLLGAQFAEGDKEFVIHCMAIVQQCSYYALNLFDSHIIQRKACFWHLGILGPGAILDFCVPVGRQLGFYWCGVPILEEDLVGAVFHSKATGALGAVPVQVNSSKLGARPIHGDGVVLLEGLA